MRHAVIHAVALALAFTSATRAAPAAPESATRARWSSSEFDATLVATPSERHVLLVVSAAWCGPCNQLAAEVLDAEGAERALAGDAGLRVDFDTDAGQALTARFAVINLPTTLLIDAHGLEVGRVEGYDGPEAWLEAIAAVRGGRSGLTALAAAAADGRPESRLRLAQAELFAGHTARAEASLASLWVDPNGTVAAMAARTWGRYLLRVRREAPQALAFFDAMSVHFAALPKDAAHFRYWAASALHATGDRAGASERFVRWIAEAPEDPRPLAMAANFHVHFAYPRAICDAAIAAMVKRSGLSADGHYLSAVTARAAGDVVTARREAAAAVALSPKEALYRNLARQLGAP